MEHYFNQDIFEYKCDAVIIPISTTGKIAPEFEDSVKALERSEGSFYLKRAYDLGEIIVRPVSTDFHLRFVIFACTIDPYHYSYNAIRRIAQDVVRTAHMFKLKKIITPLLGVETGHLDPDLCYQLFWEEFRKDNYKLNAELFIITPEKEIRTEFNQGKNIPFLEYDEILEKEFNRVMDEPEIISLQRQTGFYYEAINELFVRFENTIIKDTKLYEHLLELIDREKKTYITILKQLNDVYPEGYKFMQLCVDFISHIHPDGYIKNLNNKKERWSAAYQGQRYTEWIKHLIIYKKGYNDLDAIKNSAVKNIIRYFRFPEKEIPIFSLKYRTLITEKLSGKPYSRDYFAEDVFNYFQDKYIKVVQPENRGALYGKILLSPEIKPIWHESNLPRLRLTRAGKMAGYEVFAKAPPKTSLAEALILNCKKNKSERLDLGRCGLTTPSSIPDLLWECTHLKELCLSNEWAEYDNVKGVWKRVVSSNQGTPNYLVKLPDRLAELVNLEIFICGGDWLKDKEEKQKWRIEKIDVLAALSRLKYINLSNNSIRNIEALGGLKRLKVLHLNNNRIEEIDTLAGLPELEKVYISDNQITDVTPLEKLEHLTGVDLHSNQIKDLSGLKELISRLGIENSKWKTDKVCVAKNPLEKPPVQIVEQGKEAVLLYFKDIAPRKRYVNKDIKIILVGNSEAGKTTLAKYLNNEKDLDKEHPSTHWMEEIELESKAAIERIGTKCKIHLFDFGGHDYFHDTHHMFYSNNTIYILLWDKDTNHLQPKKKHQWNQRMQKVWVHTQDFPVKYWLESVRFFVKDDVKADNIEWEIPQNTSYTSYLLMVQNKVSDASDIVHLNNKQLTEKYPFIYDFINISILPEGRRNMDYFDSILKEVLQKTGIIGSVLPYFYGVVKEHITGSYSGPPIISLKEFHNYCNSLLKEEITVEQCIYLADYLQQIGVILQNRKNRDKIYINKKWIIKRIYNVLEDLRKKGGEFDFAHVNECMLTSEEKGAISERTEALENHKQDAADLISIMQDFNMIFRHPYEEKYIAPLYLPGEPASPANMWIGRKMIPYRRLEYSGFIHKHVILKFFQEYGQLLCGEKGKADSYYWKDALLVRDPETESVVLIRFNMGNSDEGNAWIDIFDRTGDQVKDKYFIEGIVAYLKKINQEYELEEMVTIDGKEFVSLEIIKEKARARQTVFTEQRRADKELLEKTNKKIYKLSDYSMFVPAEKKKVAISYSKRDVEHLEELRKHLRPLEDRGLIEKPFDCSHELYPGDEWHKKIQAAFSEADIVIFLVSPNFNFTDYIRENEIKPTIERYYSKGTVKIVPIILDFCDWERDPPYDLQTFDALPYDAKPISDFANPSVPWYEVGTALKNMIRMQNDPDYSPADTRQMQDLRVRQIKGKLDKNS